MNLNKTAIASAMTLALGVASTTASADQIAMNFDGLFSLGSAAGVIQVNSDSALESGYRTAVAGTGSFDTVSGSGTAQIDAFSFFGGGLASATNTTFQAIGDGLGGAGPLVAGEMGFNWNGNAGIPVTAIFDASGFFGSIGAVGTTWTVGTGCGGCATSTTAGWSISIPVIGTFTGQIGAVPMAMTNFNTAGTTLGNLFPLVDDGVAGSPMTTAPFAGFNADFDFTTINAANVAVPVPAAVWLFGSGLIGLVGVARRRRQS